MRRMAPSLLAQAILALLAAEPMGAVALQGVSLPLPRTAARSTDERPLNLLISAQPQVLTALLERRGFVQMAAEGCGEPYRVDGARPELTFVRDATCSEGPRTELWVFRTPHRARRLPLFAAVAVERDCNRSFAQCSGACAEASATDAAAQRALLALGHGLSQARAASWSDGGAPVPWVQVEPPPRRALGQGEDVALAAPAVSPEVIETLATPDRVALTFDACATYDRSGYDAKVISALEEAQAPATLFVSGRWALNHPEEMAALAQNPLFEIGNHAFIHPRLTELPPERIRDELLFTQRVLFSFTGKVPRLFRPPYGVHSAALVEEAARLGLLTVQYDLAAGDSDPAIPAERLTEWVVSRARGGSVVVMHMNGRGRHTAASLPEILRGLRAKGLQPSQVGQMIQATQVHTARAEP